MTEPDSLPEWLGQRARLTPDRLALVFGGERWTFAELDRGVEAAAGGLQAKGVGEGDRVALLGQNSAAFVQAFHAIARLGAVVVPLNVRLSEAELAWQTTDSSARFLVADEARLALAQSVAGDVGVVALALAEVTPAASAAAPAAAETRERVPLARPHSILYTSGTTGRPKGAVLTHGNHLWSAVGSVLNLGLSGDDRWLACMPLFHVGGLAILLRSVLYGMAVVLQETFEPQAVNAAIDEERVTIISVVPNMLQRLIEARGDRPFPSSLRCVLVGGGPAPRPLLEECARRALPAVQTYGLTEAASQVTTLAPEEALTRLGSAGKPLLPTEVSIQREDGSPCGPAEAGEICIRGPSVMASYLNRPEETAMAWRGGWFHTGDIGQLDEEGYLFVIDRRDDLVVSGGENVYPAEVEAVLVSHAAVLESAVFPVADERWGQAVAAAVVLRPGQSVGADELGLFCRERLAAFKAPKRFIFLAALPRNAAGKVLRASLRQDWERGERAL